MKNESVYSFDNYKKERRDRNKGKKTWRNREHSREPAQQFLDNFLPNQAIEENESHALNTQNYTEKDAA